MKIGIVILNYNDSETTVELLERIKQYEVLDKIVIVDNNSTDNSYQILEKYKNDKIKIIKSNKNAGYSAGNNIGCKYLADENMDFIIISNPDVIFYEKDILDLCDSFKNANTAIVAPVIKEHENLNRGWKSQSVYNDALSNVNYIGRMFKRKLLYNQEHYRDTYSKVDVVSGCFFIIRKDVMKKIDYFDENVFLYYEENILAKKIQKLDMDIIINNNVQIIHNHSVSIDKSCNKIKKFKMLAKSQRYFHKNYNNAGIIKMMVLYVSYGLTLAISNIINVIQKIKI